VARATQAKGIRTAKVEKGFGTYRDQSGYCASGAGGGTG
jgi:hypothetical protein